MKITESNEDKIMYELIKKDGLAKRGRLHTVHGVIETPVPPISNTVTDWKKPTSRNKSSHSGKSRYLEVRRKIPAFVFPFSVCPVLFLLEIQRKGLSRPTKSAL